MSVAQEERIQRLEREMLDLEKRVKELERLFKKLTS